MPDAAAVEMQADVLERTPPALSATSDAPDIAPKEDADTTPAKVRDPSTGRFAAKTLDNTQDASDTGASSAQTESEAAPAVAKEAKGDEAPGAVEPKANPEREANRAFARLRAENASLTQRIAALEAQNAPKPEPEEPRPTIDQFSTPEAYDQAHEQWAMREGEKRGRAAALQAARQAAEKARVDAFATAHQEREAEFAEDHPDYDEVAKADDVKITFHMRDAIYAADNGPQVAYWLGQHKDESARIAGLDPLKAIVEIGKLAAKLAEPPQAPRVRKPNPIRPVGSGSSPNLPSPDEMTTDQYAEMMRANGRLKFGPQRQAN